MPNYSRRSVMQAAALVPLQAVRGSAQNSAQNSTIRIGLIGAGSRGTYTATTIAKDPRAKVVAICDVVEEQITKARARIGALNCKPRARKRKDHCRCALGRDEPAWGSNVTLATARFRTWL